jgi:hypothetical protein
MKKLTLLMLLVGMALSGYAQRKAPAADVRKIYIHLTDTTIIRPVWEVEYIDFNIDSNDLSCDAPTDSVDLGLSVKWAPFNLGAESVTDRGYLVGWGDATGLNRSTNLKYYPTLNPTGNIINTEKYDLAKVMWKDLWRMPSEGEIDELLTQCDWEFTEQDGVSGYLVKSRTNANSIFLPLTGKRVGDDDNVTETNVGFYWSGILAENKDSAVMLSICNDGSKKKTEMLRSTGLAIRPVYGDYRQKVEVSFDEGNVKKDKTSATFPLNFTGSLSFVTEYGVAYATSEATLDVQGNSKVKVSGEPKESETIKVTGLEPNTTYYFKAYAITEGNYTESEVFTVTTDAKFPIPEAVDLGLSVKWAAWNMGASSINDVGGYYGWGDPTGELESYTSSDYATGYKELSICGTRYDIATVNWGKDWRLPTVKEIQDLLDNSTIQATIQDDVPGYLLTCNGKTLFLPKGGYKLKGETRSSGVMAYYWTGEQSDQLYPYDMCVSTTETYKSSAIPNKAYHMLIRPVYIGGSSSGGDSSTNAYDKYAVDLGLSSLWSSVNLGATKETQSGKFYAWGETESKTSFTKDNYAYTIPGGEGENTYQWLGDESGVISGTEYDAVKVAWGGDWVMPTYYDLDELYELCKWEATTKSGVAGYKVTGPNGNSIFLPLTGYYNGSELQYAGQYARYWAGTVRTLSKKNEWGISYNLNINPENNVLLGTQRHWGAVIRPVKKK